MKKYYAAFLAGSLALVGCSSSNQTKGSGEEAYSSNVKVGDIKLANTDELTEATSYQIQQMDYLVTALAEDHEYNANFVDGLLENDKYGNLAPALATSYEVSEDGLKYTFHLREGVKWVSNTGVEYDTVKADDFVAGLRHGAEFNSGTAWLLQGVVKGYSEFFEKPTEENWKNVGVKAVDDLTLEYTLEAPTPYFPSMTTYAVLYPVNRDFLESKGEGCKLGAGDAGDCSFGTTAADSILYNGGYILESYDEKASTVLVKNENYWDADNIKLTKITRIYDDGSDPYSGIRSFENNIYAQAGLSAQWTNFEDYMKKYEGYTTESLANPTVFGLVFNFNRQTFDNTNYAAEEGVPNAEADRTHEAILNANFRKALRAAWDRQKMLQVSAPESLAKAMLRNFNNYPLVVRTSDGTSYGELVNDAYEARTGEAVDLSDGQNPWNPEDALTYLDAARADGLDISKENPIHLDMLVPDTNKRLVDQGQSMKKSIEEATDGQIVIELVMRDLKTVQNIAYYSNSPEEADYDISTFTGWSPDYADPKSFVDIYSSTTGYYMKSMGLTAKGDENYGNDDDIKKIVGLAEYEQLYRDADAIATDLDARYAAFAKADAQLVDTCFFIPGQMQTRSVRVTHVKPFTRVYSVTGLSEYKYKGLELNEGLTTAEEYQAALADFETGGTAPVLTK